jgi:hypothetical protein
LRSEGAAVERILPAGNADEPLAPEVFQNASVLVLAADDDSLNVDAASPAGVPGVAAGCAHF